MPIKLKITDFQEKKIIEHFYDSWSLKSEKLQGHEILAMNIILLESIYSVPTCLRFFNPSIHILSQKTSYFYSLKR